jgi:hypothetical protein
LELLLIFSALLSAVTGALTGVRAPEPRLHQASASIEAGAVAAPAAVAPARIAVASKAAPVLARPARTATGLAFALALPAPLETVRLLE